MTARRLSTLTLASIAAAMVIQAAGAQQRQRFLYAALPGVGGGNNLKYGGAGILVFDIDHGHKFVRRHSAAGRTADAATQRPARKRSKASPRMPRPRVCMCRPAAASRPTT